MREVLAYYENIRFCYKAMLYSRVIVLHIRWLSANKSLLLRMDDTRRYSRNTVLTSWRTDLGYITLLANRTEKT